LRRTCTRSVTQHTAHNTSIKVGTGHEPIQPRREITQGSAEKCANKRTNNHARAHAGGTHAGADDGASQHESAGDGVTHEVYLADAIEEDLGVGGEAGGGGGGGAGSAENLEGGVGGWNRIARAKFHAFTLHGLALLAHLLLDRS